MWTKKEIDKLLEKELETNKELKELFEKHPEQKELYKQKLYDSQGGGGGMKVNKNCQCNTCMFAEIIHPIGRQPQSRYCQIYDVKSSDGKPDEILFDGEACEYHEKQK